MKFDVDSYQYHYKKEKCTGKFINRELSWLEFNKRVLFCSLRNNNPLNERMNFLGITSSNLDEFISVRFANAFNDQENEPYEKILKGIKNFKDMQNSAYITNIKEIEKRCKVEFVKPNKLNKKEKDKLKEIYYHEVFPCLTPIDVSNNIDLESTMMYIAVIIKRNNYENLNVIPLLNTLQSIYRIGNKVIYLEDMVLEYMEDSLFINQTVTAKSVFRIIKDGSVILSHDNSKFIIDRMTDTINNRNHSKPLFIEMRDGTDDALANILISHFKIPPSHWYKKNIIGNYKIFCKEKILDNECYPDFRPFHYENEENFYNIFEAIDHEDILLHHPYDSYDTVVKFLQHASVDPNVETIRQTLYRVSSIDSPIVKALCDASDNRKFVTVLVEIKARFDENNNIRVIEKLKRHNVNVVLGDEYLKTHCKMCLVTRRNHNGKLKVYSHVATGNYNEKTSKIYTDISYFTSKQKTGIDLLNVFNILSGHSRPDENLEKVFYSPVNLRKQLEKCIDREIAYAKKGKKAEIFIKVNSISDTLMVNKIYEAEKAGVPIQIICRGVCSLVPSKDNLKVKSIVGRFLEHSRIYYFKNSGYFISSADLLTRNLDRRVETLISLKDSNVVKQLKWIISVMKHDRLNSFELDKNGEFKRMKGDFDSHSWFANYSDIRKRKKGWK